jgi:hypothetical protein
MKKSPPLPYGIIRKPRDNSLIAEIYNTLKSKKRGVQKAEESFNVQS